MDRLRVAIIEENVLVRNRLVSMIESFDDIEIVPVSDAVEKVSGAAIGASPHVLLLSITQETQKMLEVVVTLK